MFPLQQDRSHEEELLFASCGLDYGKGKDNKNKRGYAKANMASAKSHSSSDALVAQQALQASAVGNWIVDSGATCHMCSEAVFQVDPRTGQGTVTLMLNLKNDKSVTSLVCCMCI